MPFSPSRVYRTPAFLGPISLRQENWRPSKAYLGPWIRYVSSDASQIRRGLAGTPPDGAPTRDNQGSIVVVVAGRHVLARKQEGHEGFRGIYF